MRNLLFAVSVLLLLEFPDLVSAGDLFNCNGVWKSSPCEGGSGGAVDLPGISRSNRGGPEKPAADSPSNQTAPSPSAIPAEQKTRLRVSGDPNFVWKLVDKTTLLANATVSVSNVGSIEAKNVRVSLFAPGGPLSGYSLSGSDVLAPGETGKYILDSAVEMRAGVKPNAQVSCSNCYK